MNMFWKIIYIIFAVMSFPIATASDDSDDDSFDVEVVDLNSKSAKHCLDSLDITKLKVQMSEPEMRFLSLLIKRYRPEKIVEIGVADGGSSVIILNAAHKGAKLYSIDVSADKKIGREVHRYFSKKITNNRKLYTGNITAKFIEEIGEKIDFVFIDTVHSNPGEILDFLQILPYLSEGAVIVFHDVSCHLFAGQNLWTNCVLLSTIRGRKITPSRTSCNKSWPYDVRTPIPNIGAIKLEKNQKRFIFDYFNLLALPWFYSLKKEHIDILESFFRKHYGDASAVLFSDMALFNAEKEYLKPCILGISIKNIKQFVDFFMNL
jgi:predicted O-methyltransferase YrrM